MKNYLLSIGIGQYANQGAELLSLGRVPANDCDRLAEVLCSELYGFELIQDSLLNEHASHDVIISALDKLTTLEEDSQTIVFFSGHGEFFANHNMSYWLTHEAVEPSKFNPAGDLAEQGWISAKTVVEKVNAARSRHVLILADCCYAGHMRYNFRGMGGHIYPDYTKLAIRTKSREILTPCSVTKTSTASGDDSVSNFVECIANRLEKKAPFTVISPPMLYGELLSSHQKPQYGHLQGANEPGGYFLFTSPKRLGEIFEEPFEQNDLTHHVLCKKLEQKLRPISSAIERSRYLDGFVGRQWVFDEINAWIADPSSRLFWLTGEPGIGKSAVSAYLAEHNEVICAHHFFLFDKAPTLDLKQVTKSLAYQLAQVLPDYANHADLLDDEKLQELDGQSLFDDLIITPLAQIVSDPTIPVVMLLDGLDEASKNGKNEIAEYLAKLIDTAPAWLKIMFTSRTRESEINRSLGRHRPWPLDAGDPRNFEDLILYLKKHLPASITRPKLRKAILGKSEGSFLYIKHLCDDWVQREEIPDISQLPAGLYGIYEQFFRRQFSKIDYYEEQALHFLELIIGAYEPLSVLELAEFSGTSEREIRKVRRRMGSLIRDSEGKLEFCHKSLPDWLTINPSSEFYISEADAHLYIVEVGWAEFLSASGLISPYFLRNLIRHCEKISDELKIKEIQSEYRYYEKKALIGDVFSLLEELELIGSCSTVHADLKTLVLAVANDVEKHPSAFYQCLHMELHRRGLCAFAESRINSEWFHSIEQSTNSSLVHETFTSKAQSSHLIYSIEYKENGCLLHVDQDYIHAVDDSIYTIYNLDTGKILSSHALGNEPYGAPIFSMGDIYYACDHIYRYIPKSRRRVKLECKQVLTGNEEFLQCFPSSEPGIVYFSTEKFNKTYHIYIADFVRGTVRRLISEKVPITCCCDNTDSAFIALYNGDLIIYDKQTWGRRHVSLCSTAICKLMFRNGILVIFSMPANVKWWRVNDAELLRNVDLGKTVESISICGDQVWTGDGMGRISKYAKGKKNRFSLAVHSCPVQRLFVLPERRIFVSEGAADSRIVVSKESETFDEHSVRSLFKEEISDLCFSNDGLYLLISVGSSLELFDIKNLERIKRIKLQGEIKCLLSEGVGRTLYVLTSQSLVKVGIPELRVDSSTLLPFIGARELKHVSRLGFILIIGLCGLAVFDAGNLCLIDKRDNCGTSTKNNLSLEDEDLQYIYLRQNWLCAEGVKELSRYMIYFPDEVHSSERDERVHIKGAYNKKKDIFVFNERSRVVVQNGDISDHIDYLPFKKTDLEYLASCWKEQNCVFLSSKEDGSVLSNHDGSVEYSWIPEQFEIIRKHPHENMWATAHDNVFKLLSV